jgi:hypothetical protein
MREVVHLPTYFQFLKQLTSDSVHSTFKMMNFFRKRFDNVRFTSRPQPQSPYPPSWPLQGEHHAKPETNAQSTCPLYGKLSAELRILIYQAVLTDPGRLLHVCINRIIQEKRKKKDIVRAVAHRFCTEMDSPYPKWQHLCYGGDIEYHEGLMITPYHTRSFTTKSGDQLLSLLLTCRLM